MIYFSLSISLSLLFPTFLWSQTTRSQVIMGTFCTISLEENKSKHIQEGFELFKTIESSLSSYDKNAKVYKLNHQEKVLSDKYLDEVLKKSREIYQVSEGYFDITIGSVTKGLYHFGEKEQIPTQKELRSAKVEMSGIIENNGSIFLKKGIKVDLGGIGKGYAIDKVAQYFSEQNIYNGKIALSGDIRCLNACEFAIQSPFEENKTLMILKSKIPNLSISTSGTYRRYIKEKKYHHLINPRSKKQGRAFVSVTILTNADNTKADAIATAVSVMPKEEALNFLKKEGVGSILVQRDENVSYCNLDKFIILPKSKL